MGAQLPGVVTSPLVSRGWKALSTVGGVWLSTLLSTLPQHLASAPWQTRLQGQQNSFEDLNQRDLDSTVSPVRLHPSLVLQVNKATGLHYCLGLAGMNSICHAPWVDCCKPIFSFVTVTFPVSGLCRFP